MIYAFLTGLVFLFIILLLGQPINTRKKSFHIYNKSKTSRRFLYIVGIALITAIILFLVFTGRISAFLAILSFLFVWLVRALQIGIMYHNFKRAKNYSKPYPDNNASKSMTKAQALKTLGLKNTATEAEIKKAYRDLMARLHPDHGGNEYLAAQLNEAKEVLLKKK